MPEVLTAEEASRVLQVSRSTITNWVNEGRLQPIGRVGNHERAPYVFPRDHIYDVAIAERETECQRLLQDAAETHGTAHHLYRKAEAMQRYINELRAEKNQETMPPASNGG